MRARLWWRTRRSDALLLAPFRITGSRAGSALSRIEIGEQTRIGQFAWFSLVSDDSYIKIGSKCTLSANLSITARGLITIGDSTAIGERCLIADHGHDHSGYLGTALAQGTSPEFSFAKSETRPVVIGNGVHIGVNVCISPGVSIGDGAVVGANSVVTRDVAPYTVVAGAPARLIRSFDRAEGTGQA